MLLAGKDKNQELSEMLLKVLSEERRNPGRKLQKLSLKVHCLYHNLPGQSKVADGVTFCSSVLTKGRIEINFCFP